MRIKPVIMLILISITLLVGGAFGAIVQKTRGVGNILRSIGIPYPTAVPEVVAPPVVNIPPAFRGQLSLFILAGQSNMVGVAPLPQEEESNPRVFVFGNDYHWHIAREPVDDPYNQVDIVSLDRVAAFGPSLSFALAILEHDPEMVIGLIPCAKSSSSIVEWQRNLSDQSLYGSCLKRARAASPMGQLSGILFFQGEEDAIDPIESPQHNPSPSQWSLLFSEFVTAIRNDLDEPDLPVVFAQLGSDPAPEAFPNWQLVKEQQLSTHLPMTAMIQTDDLPLLDGLHFTTDSYRMIGKRFADAYWELIATANK
jgi:hypothetical protein